MSYQSLAPRGARGMAPPQATFAAPTTGRFVRPSNSNVSLKSEAAVHHYPSISEKYILPLDPADLNGPEADDSLHHPDPRRDYKADRSGRICTSRGLMNLGCVAILVSGIVALFAGFPIITFFTSPHQSLLGGFNLGGTNATGQVPNMPGNWGLIDRETPMEFRTKPDYVNGKTWELVFSDEFNTDGRSFYPGDDPYWEAVDLHYWSTNNLEWYDPAQITTRDGALEITLTDKPSHNLNYTGGMMSTWNKFCFTGGLVEASVILPGANSKSGLWPAIWAMGNLGRAGYGATLEGLWPYSYDACDVGTVANQTWPKGLPVAATVNGDPSYDDVLSYLPGQRLSRCTCRGESHPGPVHADTGEYVGRSAPEIDMFEAQVGDTAAGKHLGSVSQSGQWAPYNAAYTVDEDAYIIYNASISQPNGYRGGIWQQATSVVTVSNPNAYELNGAEYATYGFQYKPGFGDAYISWINNGVLSWTLPQSIMAADLATEISERPISQEPMYLIVNLGISKGFGFIDPTLTFPTKLRVDWIRVYQDPDAKNIGCDPPDFPTKAYIDEYMEAYTNPNITTWVDDFGQSWPKNSFRGECSS